MRGRMSRIVSRRQYFDTALTILADTGFKGLNIGRLCETLGVTSGSFYHHFGSWQDFVDEFLAAWEGGQATVLRELDFGRGNWTSDVDAMRKLTLGLNHEAEAAIRAWSANDESVRVVQQRMDALARRDRRPRGRPGGARPPHRGGAHLVRSRDAGGLSAAFAGGQAADRRTARRVRPADRLTYSRVRDARDLAEAVPHHRWPDRHGRKEAPPRRRTSGRLRPEEYRPGVPIEVVEAKREHARRTLGRLGQGAPVLRADRDQPVEAILSGKKRRLLTMAPGTGRYWSRCRSSFRSTSSITRARPESQVTRCVSWVRPVRRVCSIRFQGASRGSGGVGGVLCGVSGDNCR